MKEILLLNDGNEKYNFYGEICSFLDTCMNDSYMQIVREFGQATYVCNYTDQKPNIKVIRAPGATRGCIELNDNNIIMDMKIYEGAFTGPVACYDEQHKYKIKEQLDSCIGCKLVFLYTHDETMEQIYYKIIKNDDLFLLKRLNRIYPTMILEAASYGAINILKYLVWELKMPMDYDTPGTAKNTPFKQACEKCELEVAKYLVEMGTDMSNLDIVIDWTEDTSKLQAMTDYLNSIGLEYKISSTDCCCQ